MEVEQLTRRLAEGAAAIDLSVIMGGITLRVPRGWRVEMDARPLLGGIDRQRVGRRAADVRGAAKAGSQVNGTGAGSRTRGADHV